MKRKDLLIILVPSFIFAILWIVFSINHAINTPTITDSENMQISPISPNFDYKIIDSLKKRGVITPIYEISGATKNPSSSIPTTSLSVSLVSSLSASQASSGGTLR